MAIVYLQQEELEALKKILYDLHMNVEYRWDGERSIYFDHQNEDFITGLAHLIDRTYRKEYIIKLLKEHYFYEDPKEINKILDFVEIMNQHEEEWPGESFSIIQIKNKLHSYLEEATLLIPKGFFYFRLKPLLHDDRTLVEEAIDEYLMAKEYKEFVSHLHYFVESQEDKTTEINLFYVKGNHYYFFDHLYRPLQSEEIKELYDVLIEHNTSYEEVIINVLLFIAPGIIHIHTKVDDDPILQTIKRVFGERVRVCKSCVICDGWNDDFQVKNL